jgi:hypothetical protein
MPVEVNRTMPARGKAKPVWPRAANPGQPEAAVGSRDLE